MARIFKSRPSKMKNFRKIPNWLGGSICLKRRKMITGIFPRTFKGYMIGKLARLSAGPLLSALGMLCLLSCAPDQRPAQPLGAMNPSLKKLSSAQPDKRTPEQKAVDEATKLKLERDRRFQKMLDDIDK